MDSYTYRRFVSSSQDIGHYSWSRRGELEHVMLSGVIPFPARDSKSIDHREFVSICRSALPPNLYVKLESAHFRGSPVERHLNRDPYYSIKSLGEWYMCMINARFGQSSGGTCRDDCAFSTFSIISSKPNSKESSASL